MCRGGWAEQLIGEKGGERAGTRDGLGSTGGEALVGSVRGEGIDSAWLVLLVACPTACLDSSGPVSARAGGPDRSPVARAGGGVGMRSSVVRMMTAWLAKGGLPIARDFLLRVHESFCGKD